MIMKRYILLLVAIIGISINGIAHDFSATYNGKIIYYTITSSTNNTVAVSFQGTSYTSYSGEYSGAVEIPSSVIYNGNTYSVTSIAASAFRSCTGLTEVTIPSTITSIGNYAFNSCTGLNTIFWNATNVTSYTTNTSYNPFYGCSSLQYVYIGDNVTTVPSYTFYGRSSIEVLILGEKIKTINSYAFYGCTGLKTIHSLSIVPPTISSTYSFSNVPKSLLLYVSCESLTSYSSANYWSTFTNYKCVNKEKEIFLFSGSCGADTYWGLDNEGTLTIYGIGMVESYPLIGASPWYPYASNIKKIVVEKGVSLLSFYSLAGCSSATSIEFKSEHPLSTEPNTFEGISGTTPVIVPCGTILDYEHSELSLIFTNIYEQCSSVVDGCEMLSGTCGGNTNWSLDCNGLLTISGTGAMRNFSSLQSTPWYNKRSSIKRIVIEDGVTSIGSYAFADCDILNTVVIGKDVETIGNNAFNGCDGLSQITLPESVTSIGTWAFANCYSLMTVAWNATKVISYPLATDNPFYNCTNLSQVTFGTNVVSIPSYALYENHGISKLTIPQNVTTIGASAFYNCSELYSVTLSSSLQTIGSNAFNGCGLLSLTLPVTVVSIGANAFSNCSNLTSVTWNSAELSNYPEIATQLPFYGSTKIETVTFSNDVVVVPAHAFQNSTSILKVTFGNALTTVGEYALSNCTGINSLALENNVKTLHNSAFNGCSNLQTVTFANGLQYIGDSVLYGTNIQSLTIPTTVVSIGNNAFSNCSQLQIVNWDAQNVATYPSSASRHPFVSCSELQKVIFGSSVTMVPDYAFQLCTIVDTVVVGNAVTMIGSYAFNGCAGLKKLILGSAVETIGEAAFKECIGLSAIALPGAVTSIGDYAFEGITKLSSLAIPAAVTSIGDYAFAGCNGICTIRELSALPPTIGTNTYSGVANSIPIYVPCIAREDYQSASNWEIFTNYVCDSTRDNCNYIIGSCGTNLTWSFSCDSVLTISGTGTMDNYTSASVVPWSDLQPSIKSIQIGNEVTSIGNYAFASCENVKTVSIGSQVTSIGIRSFEGCQKFTSLILPNLVTTIGANAFNNCTSLTNVTWNSNAVTSYPGSSVTNPFTECTGLSKVIFGNTVQSVPHFALYGSSVDTVLFGSAVASIGNYALYNCSDITTIILPENVSAIGISAFKGCTSLDSIMWKSTNITAYPVEIGMLPFENCPSLQTISFGDQVQSIPQNAFYNNTSVKKITLGKSVTNVGSTAFYGCSSLNSLVIPQKVSTIGNNAFSNCRSLVSITWNAKNVSSYPTSMETLPFVNCSALQTITFGNTVQIIPTYAFANSASVQFVSIGDSVKTIGGYAFYGCTAMSELNLGKAVQTIETNSFYGCASLKKISIPSTVSTIGTYAFNNCTNLLSVEWNAKEMENYPISSTTHPFAGCSKLASVSFGDSVQIIPAYALSNVETISDVTISAGVSAILNYAFSNCTGLQYIREKSKNPPTVFTNTFNGVSTNISIYVPCSSLSAYKSTSQWSNFTNYICDSTTTNDCDLVIGTCGTNVSWMLDCNGTMKITGTGEMENYSSISVVPWNTLRSSIKKIEFDSTITSISSNAFYGCINVDTISLLPSISSIGENAFANCSALTTIMWNAKSVSRYPTTSVFTGCSNLNSIILGDSVQLIPAYAFYNCSTIKALEIPANVTSIGDYAFAGTGLTKLTEKSTVIPTIGANTFANVVETIPVYVPCVALESYMQTTTWLNFVNYVCDSIVNDDCTILKGSCGTNLTWNFDCDSVLTISGTGDMISYTSFWTTPWSKSCYNYVKSIVIEDGVTSICDEAFRHCSNVESVTIGESVEKIGLYAFASNTSLKTIYWNAKNITDYPAALYVPFQSCLILKSVVFGDSVQTIPANAFYGCSTLKNITIGTSISIIGNDAFKDCSSLSSVDWNARYVSSYPSSSNLPFNGCSSLKKVSFGDTVQRIPAYAFSANISLDSVVFGTSVSSIGNYAFNACTGLSTILWNAKNVTTYPTNTSYLPFVNCTSLRTVIFGDQVLTIPAYCLYGCSLIDTLVIPENVVTIGNRAFYNCTGLRFIQWNAKSITSYPQSTSSDYPFYGCTKINTVVFGDKVLSVPAYALYNRTSLKNIDFGSSLQIIGPYAFYGCTGLNSIILTKNINTLGSYAFSGCSNISNIIWDAENVINYPSSTSSVPFVNCSLLKTVEFTSSVRSIPAYAFYGNTSIIDIEIGDSVESIGTYAFYNNKITSIRIPKAMTVLGDYAFGSCTVLSSILDNAKQPQSISSNTFSGISKNIPIYIPCESLSAYSQSEYWSTFKNYRCDTIIEDCKNVAYGSCGADVVWKLDCDSVLTITGSGPMTSFGTASDVPWYIERENIKSIVVDSVVTSIGDYAFYGCKNAESIIVSETINTIGVSALYNCSSITKFTIPDSTKSIGTNAFNGCTSLQTIEWNAKNVSSYPSTSANLPFAGCSSLESVNFADNVESIPAYAFNALVGIKNLEIGESVKTIGSYAFRGCTGLKNITIPNSVTTIGSYTFASCLNLQSVVVEASVPPTISSNTFNSVSTVIPIYVPCEDLSIYESSLYWSNFTNFVCEEDNNDCNTIVGTCGSAVTWSLDCKGNLVIKGTGPMKNYTSTDVPWSAYRSLIKQIIIDSLVTSIGDYAFYDCSNASFVNIGPDVLSIGLNAFYNCSSIETLSIPEFVSGIGNKAFYKCTSLSVVYWKAKEVTSYPTSGDNAPFAGCSALQKVYFDTLVHKIPNYAFYALSSIDTVVFDEALLSIGSYAFYGCTGLTTLTIPKNVSTIGNYAFNGCLKLKTLDWEAKNISSYPSSSYLPFADCSNLTSVSFGDSVQVIPAYAFYNTNIENIVLGKSITSIKNNSFANTKIKSLLITNSIDTIGTNAFKGCTALTKIEWLVSDVSSYPSTSTNAPFSGCSGVSNVTIGENVQMLPEYAFYGCTNLVKVDWNAINVVNYPNTTSALPFYNCSVLKTVVFGNSVEIIPDSAFYNNSSIISVQIGKSVSEIGNKAFYGCSGLKSTYYAGDIAGWCSIRFDGGANANPVMYSRNLYIDSTLVEKIIIPSTIQTIKNHVFFNCESLKNVTLSDGIITIERSAFYSCINIDSLDLGGTLQTIGTYAFYKNSSLTNISFPNSLQEIGDSSFYDCSGLQSLVLGENVKMIGSRTFYGSTELQTIEWNAINVSGASTTIFSSLPNLKVLQLGAKVSVLSENCFPNMTNVQLIRSLNSEPPSFSGTKTFTGYPQNVLVEIPCGSLDDYTRIAPSYIINSWQDFSNYTEIIPYEVSVDVNDTNLGSVSYDCVAGEGVELFASASSNYHFVSWNDGETQNPRFISLTQDTSFVALFSIDEFSIDVTSNIILAGTVSGMGIFEYGSVIEISAEPAEHYNFVSWNDGVVSNPRRISVFRDREYTAIFEIDSFYISAYSNDNLMGVCYGSGNYAYDEFAYLTAIPRYGYQFVEWSDGYKENPRMINVSQSDSYIAMFALDTFSISVNSIGNGIIGIGGTVTGGGEYVYMNSVTLAAIPDDHYHFYGWSDGCTDNPRQIMVSQSKNYEAIFYKDTVSIFVESENPNLGIVSGTGNYEYGTIVNIVAIPDFHSHFLKWQDGNTQASRYVTATTNMVYKAYFSLDTMTIDVVCHDKTKGTVSGGGLYPYNTRVNIKADAVEHYHFSHWQDGNTSNPRTIFADDDMVYTAYFELDRYEINGVVDERGNILGTGTYSYGSTATLTAVPKYGYQFSNWSDGVKDNPRSVFVDGKNVLFEAIFEPNEYMVSVTYGDGGIVRTSGSSKYGEIMEITAVPYEHYHFVKWSDGSTNINRIVMITGDASFSAEFAIDTISISGYSDNSKGTVVGYGEYVYNKIVKLTANAKRGFHFDYWDVEGEKIYANPYSLIAVENKVINPIFYKDEYMAPVICLVNDKNAGKVVWDDREYYYGTPVMVRAVANSGYRFVNWSDGSKEMIRTIYANGVGIVANFSPLTAIETISLNELYVYPNPVKDVATLSMDEIELIEVFDMRGNKVAVVEGLNSIDMSGIKAGQYSLVIKTNQGTVVRKIVKM